MSTFKELSSIDVSKHLEEKQGLSYLQWMAAWALAKEHDPMALYHILTDDKGNPYFNDPMIGAFVGVGVTLKGINLVEYLPVLDYRNKPVIGDNLHVFDINSAIRRCLVKCLAMHGLGAQVYIDGEGHPLTVDKGLGKSKEAPKAKPKPPTSNKISF